MWLSYYSNGLKILIWVYTVCPDMSIWKLRIITVIAILSMYDYGMNTIVSAVKCDWARPWENVSYAPYANNKGADQTASLDSIAEILRL